MTRFGIDLGHGIGPDRGAVGNIAEETIINEVGTKVINKLKALGHSVVELRPSYASSVNGSLVQRYTKANNNNVDMCVSIHANAGEGVGTEVFTYNAKEVPQARAVLNNIVSLGFRNRGIKDGSSLAMVKRPSATAMLIEVCFVDSSDSDLYNSVGAENIANAIVEGLTGQSINKYKVGWNKDAKGWFYSTDGENYYNQGWQKIKDDWYYFNTNGYILGGWQQIEEDWYYFNDNEDDFGKLYGGWIVYKNKSYYLEEKHEGNFGKMYRDGVFNINGTNYTFNSDGSLVE